MVNYREILRMVSKGTNQRHISASVCSSHHTIRKVLDVAYIHAEQSRLKVTLTLIWDEYRRKVEELGRQPYMTTQFGDK